MRQILIGINEEKGIINTSIIGNFSNMELIGLGVNFVVERLINNFRANANYETSKAAEVDKTAANNRSTKRPKRAGRRTASSSVC